METMWHLLLALPMGGTSSLDPGTGLFESGMLRLVLRLANLCRGTPRVHNLFPTLSMSNALSPYLVKTLPRYQAHFHILPNIPLPTQWTLIFWHTQTQRVGSKIQKVACYIGFPQTVVQAFIRLLS